MDFVAIRPGMAAESPAWPIVRPVDTMNLPEEEMFNKNRQKGKKNVQQKR